MVQRERHTLLSCCVMHPRIYEPFRKINCRTLSRDKTIQRTLGFSTIFFPNPLRHLLFPRTLCVFIWARVKAWTLVCFKKPPNEQTLGNPTIFKISQLAPENTNPSSARVRGFIKLRRVWGNTNPNPSQNRPRNVDPSLPDDLSKQERFSKWFRKKKISYS